MTPRMDGFELLSQVKSDPELESLPMPMPTARAQDADFFRGWQSGAECYLTKPFNPAELPAFARRNLGYREHSETDGGRIYL